MKTVDFDLFALATYIIFHYLTPINTSQMVTLPVIQMEIKYFFCYIITSKQLKPQPPKSPSQFSQTRGFRKFEISTLLQFCAI